jgi:protein SCO1/2
VTPRLLFRFIQLLIGSLLAVAAVSWWLGHIPPSRVAEEVIEESYFLPAPLESPSFTLTSHFGEPTTSKDFKGKILAVFFGYTSCPDVCPLTLTRLSETFRLLEEEGNRIQVIFVSVDPARDTPGQIARYLANFHPSFLGLTGTEEEIRAVAEGFGAYFSANGSGEHYTVDHTARTFVVDTEGRIPLTFPVTASPLEMATDLATLLGDTHQ